ncbi:hypothetical protein NQ317_003582 [Molorchus minor]|uniref:Uncharacterized protein n=1 Tax=Molorchus minor TaxID=1323400 RepID=A0ABQ9JCY1_9CUCU|nr:hypothetical protein NQ317_003582 [Molorchus minor]
MAFGACRIHLGGLKPLFHNAWFTMGQYTAENILGSFPTDSLLEERAIILGRLGKHEEAPHYLCKSIGGY